MRLSKVAPLAIVLMLAGCSSAGTSPTHSNGLSTPSVLPSGSPSALPSPNVSPEVDVVRGVVTEAGAPVPGAAVNIGDFSTFTDSDGTFEIEPQEPGELQVRVVGHPAWTTAYDGGEVDLNIELEDWGPARALRVFSGTAASDERFQALLDLASDSTVNTLVFDTKDETYRVLYETQATEALAIGNIAPQYDPAKRIAQARDAGLYTVTRIVTFEDAHWASVRPDLAYAGKWVNPHNRDTWEYPLGLAAEACRIGFDEVQFDYVRFPTGKAASQGRAKFPLTEDERVKTITEFLTAAREILHPMGCAVSADIFGIVLSTTNDQGIGQRVSDVTVPLDAVSPMLYPSHYSDGWRGFEDPNDYPGPVIADALDTGIPMTAAGTEMRPWIQAFGYNAEQVQAQIVEAEKRGAGWILWNYEGKYEASWLPQHTSYPE